MFLFAAMFSLGLRAQLDENLVTHISFNKNGCNVEDEAGDPSINTFIKGETVCGCGVEENSRFFDGDDDWFYLFGQRIEETFTTIDFSLSFYFKPTSSIPSNQVLFSKKVGCAAGPAFSVKFNPANRSLSVELFEAPTINASIVKTLPFSCWYHVVVIRKDKTTILYVNNVELGRVNATVRVDIGNSGTFTAGDSDCDSDAYFEGYLDEVRLYSRALSLQDVEDLYLSPNQIKTGLKPSGVNDVSLFLGESVDIELSHTCADIFDWTPTTNVADPDQPNPTITPTETTTYVLDMTDADGCISTDSIRIVVYDKNAIQCGDILLPTAFTPNGDGPIENETFGISNIFAVGDLISFEIFDRWGNIVFYTDDVRGRWDGAYKGEPVNPSTFLYKIRYKCEGKENVHSGNITVLR